MSRSGQRAARSGHKVFGGTYTTRTLPGGEAKWNTIRLLPECNRSDPGPLSEADGCWVSELTKNIKTATVAEPFATRLKHFVHLVSVKEHVCPSDTAYAQTCRIVQTLFAYSKQSPPGFPELLNMLMAGCVPISDQVKVTCAPIQTLFPVGGASNLSYEWSTALLTTAKVHCDQHQFGLCYALSVFDHNLQLSELGTATFAPDDHAALLQSIIRLDSYGIKMVLPDHPLHTYMATPQKLLEANPGTPVAACAAALNREITADMRYFRCLPEKLLAAYGSPGKATHSPLFGGTAAEALRLTKGAFAFMNIAPEPHVELIRTIVNGLRPSVSTLPSFVIDHIDDNSFMDVAKRARTATVAEFFEGEPQYCSNNTPQLSKVCAIGCIVVAVGNYRCRHMAWDKLRLAVESASSAASGPLYIMYDEGKCLIHANGSPDVLVTEPVPWTFTQAPVVSMHVP